MSKRFWTADWHLGSSILLDRRVMGSSARPFKDIETMKSFFLKSTLDLISNQDILIHVGDFASYGIDRGHQGLKEKPIDIIAKIPGNFINLRGNHDINNNVFSVGNSLNLGLGKRYPFVSAAHYPSYDKRAIGTFTEGTIHLCGHVHKKWKHCLDLTHSVLNINVGVDVWNYKIVPEEDIIKYLNFLFSKHSDELFRIKISNGRKLEMFGSPRW